LLPELCGGKAAVPDPADSEPEPPPATPQSETSSGAKDIATHYGACIVAAKGAATKCVKLKAALDAVSERMGTGQEGVAVDGPDEEED
jgi:hypothetical protein